MVTSDELETRRANLLATLPAEAAERFSRELDAVEAAAAARYEQALGRLREGRWVPLDSVSRLIDELSGVIDIERARVAALAGDLEAAKREAEAILVQCDAAVRAAREAAARELNDAVIGFARTLRAARELAREAALAEARVREELAAVQTRAQETIDRQRLELIALKQESEEAAAAARTRAEPEPTGKTAARPAQRLTIVVPPSSLSDKSRHERTPEFAAIEAVLAGSPPLGTWQSDRNQRARETLAMS
jgi:hypothetical protein